MGILVDITWLDYSKTFDKIWNYFFVDKMVKCGLEDGTA